MTEKQKWNKTSETKPEDHKKVRAIAPDGRKLELVYMSHWNRWAFADGSMAVYFEPTHWKQI